MTAPTRRSSDRWLTPAVIIAGLIVGGLVVASVVGAVAYLAARGIDPDPLLKLSATLVGAIGGVGTFILQLAQRAQNSKTERNAGVLVGAVDDLAAVVSTVIPPAPAVTLPAPGLQQQYDDDQAADDDGTSVQRFAAAKARYAAGLQYDDELDTQQRVAVPPLPEFPRHRRSTT